MPRRKAVSAYPPVIVTWRDAASAAGDEASTHPDSLATFGRMPVVEEIGFLVAADAKRVVLAMSRCHEENTFRGSTAIPRALVLKIKRL